MNTSSADVILRGGGDMGALMRRTDWAKTALGPVEAWPQSLRLAVGILLESRFPMYLAWGREYVQLYNDGYRPMLGSTKHPAAMGGRTADTFAESWHIIGPMFEGVRGGVAAGAEDWMLPLDRSGYLEECFFTYSYSPVRDESGEVSGVHVTVVETTARVLAARRLRALHALAERTAGATTTAEACLRAGKVLEDHALDVPFALLYLLAEDGKTARLVARTGLPEGAPASLPSIALSGEQGGGWPLDAVARSGTPETVIELGGRFDPSPGGPWPEAVHTAVVLPIARPGADRPYGVMVVGVSPRRALDAEYRDFLAHVAGNVARAVSDAHAFQEKGRHAEEARAAAEAERARLYNHFMQAPFPIAVARGIAHTFELANDAILRVWGKTPVIVGQPVIQAIPEILGQPFVGYLDEVLRTGIAYEGNEALVRLARGANGALEDVYFNFVYSPLRARGGEVEGVLMCGFEVTAQVLARRGVERALAEAARLNQELQRADALFRTLVDNLPDLAWSARPDGHIDFYNKRWYDYTGTTFEQMQGWGWQSVHDPSMMDEVTRRWQSAIASGERFEMTFPLRSAEGVFCWFLTRIEPLRDAEGRVVRWIGTNTNVNVQRETQRNTEALLEEVSAQAVDTASMVRALQLAKAAAEERVRELELERELR